MVWPILPSFRQVRFRRRRAGVRDDQPAQAGARLLDDEEIVSRARGGDLSTFHELVDRHQSAVFNVVLRTVNDPESAEDITQDAFVRAWKSLSQFRGGNVRGWLMRIAINRAYDTLRSQKRKPSTSLDELEYESVPRWSTQTSAAEQPETFVDRNALATVLEQVLARLPDDQRTAVLLVDMQGFSYQEAAGIMGVAPGTIKSRMSRARAKLRQDLRAESRSSELFDRFVRLEHEDEA